MLIRFIIDKYGVKLNGWERIDIPADRQVIRVF